MPPEHLVKRENSLPSSNGGIASYSQLLPPNGHFGSGLQEPLLRTYWRVLLKRRWTVITTLVVVVALALLISLRMTPLYEASGRIVIYREASDVLGFKDLGASSTEDWDYNVALDTQVRVLRSETLAAQVIQKLELDRNPVFAGALVTAADAPPLSADPAREAALLGAYRGALNVSTVPRTRIVEIRFLSPDPKLAADAVNALAQVYTEHNYKTRFEAMVQTSEWLSKQLADLRLKVETSQERLVRYQREHNILGLDEKQNITTAKLDELNRELTSAQADRIQKEARYQLTLIGSPELVAHLEPGSLLEKLRARQAELKDQLAKMTTEFGAAYPKVMELNNQLLQTEASVQEEVLKIGSRIKVDFATAAQREKMLHAALESQKQEANLLNEDSIQFNILKRDVETNRELYEGLLQKLKEAGVSAGLRSSNVRMMDPARVPLAPSRPNIPLNTALGLLLGLAGGIVIVFVQEALDNTIRTPESVESVAALPSLAVVPWQAATNGHATARTRLRRMFLRPEPKTQSQDDSMALATQTHPKSHLAEAFRALRTSILLSSLHNPPKVLLVTSPMAGDGKTTVSTNCAIVLAQKGARVLLVDADLRRPSVNRCFGLHPTRGLSNVLTSGDSPESVILPAPDVPSLFILPAGPCPPRPAELLDSDLMRSHLKTWREQYDHIVIDTPPILAVTDGVALSVEADAVILVVRSGKTTKEAIHSARNLLFQVNAKLQGVVLNGLNPSSPDGDYYYYYYHGSRYGSEYYDQ